MALRPGHIGQRVVVRRVLLGERGPSGGPAMTDVLGVLVALTPDTLLVRRDDGEVVTVERTNVVAAKPIPPRASMRRRITPEELQRVCAAGWHAPVEQPLGDWVLRAAGGFTGRANSVLPVGDPGMPLGSALRLATEFYGRRDLPTQAQAVVGSSTMHALQEHGWSRSRPDQADAVVQVASVTMAARQTPGAPELDQVRLDPQLSSGWLHRYGRSDDADEYVVRSVLTSGDTVTFAQVGEPPVAIGRAVVTGDWVGLSAVQIDPGLRGQGLGSAVVAALLGWGAVRGARSAYVQSLSDNGAAQALYARFGFSTHYSYRYLGP